MASIEHTSRRTDERARVKEQTGFVTSTPAELGWEASRPIVGNHRSLYLTTEAINGEKVFVAVTQCLNGRMLREVLAASTKKPTPNEYAVKDDWEIYKDAATFPGEGKESRVSILLRRHKEDPVVGTAMQEFGKKYVDKWLKANVVSIEREATEAIFKGLDNTWVVDMRTFPSEFLRSMIDPKNQYEWYALIMGKKNPTFDDWPGFLQYFNHFLDDHQEEGYLLRYRETASFAEDKWRRAFEGRGIEERQRIFAKYVDWLTLPEHEVEKKAVVEGYITHVEKKILVDVADKELPKLSLPPKNSSLHKRVQKVSSKDNYLLFHGSGPTITCMIEPGENTGVPYTLTAIDVEVTPDSLVDARFPVVAWKKNKQGKREFLPLQEIKDYFGTRLAEAFSISWDKQADWVEQLDDWLGIVWLSCFSPKIIAQVPEKASLRHLPEEQDEREENGRIYDGRDSNDITAAQAPVWHNTKKRRAKIASDPDGLLASIERELTPVSR